MKIKFMKRLGGSVSTRHGKTLLRSLPLMAAGLLLCAPPTAKAADSPGVKFNNGVRYSQWAIDSRANDFYANTTAFGLAKYNLDGSVATARKDTKKKLDYVPGIVSKAMIEAADYYDSFDWSKPWFLSVKEYGDAYDAKVPETGDSFDNLNGAKLYIGLYNNKYATDADKSMVKTALASVKKGFIAANTSYVIPAGTLAEKAGYTVAGGWWHKSIYENQMWLDGAYMGSALLAQLTQFYGSSDNVFGSKTADWDMVTKQLDIVWNLCWNSTDKLMYHAFDATASAKAKDGNSNTWAGLSSTTPYVFHSAAYWGRADAWYLYALVDVLEAMKADGQENTSNYTKLKSHLDELAAGIAARQDKTTGGWYQLLDKDATYVSTKYNGSSKNDANYIETSATSLFSAAFFKAVRLGLLADSYKDVAANAFKGLVNNFATYDNDGTIQIWGSSKSAGLGGSSYRDGSNEYYLSGGDVTMVKKGETTEGKVLGGFIMAATEYERAYQNQDSKQILFAKDLAPTYDFSTTEGALDATAYGNGTVSYQWYKDGSPIADATSATYSPTESGTYKCTATANGTTITTSEAKVTAKSASSGEKDDSNTVTKKAEFSKTALGGLGNKENGVANYSQTITESGITITAVSNIVAYGASKGCRIDKNGKIKITAESGKKIKKISITTDKSSQTLTASPTGTDTNKDKVYTYDFSTNTQSEVTFTNSSSSNTYVSSIVVEYEDTSSTPKTSLTASFTPSTIDATESDTSVDLPTLSVKAGDADFTEYTVGAYTSTDDNVAKVENGKVVFGKAGNATISTTITPNDATHYNGCNVDFTVNVKEKTVGPVGPTQTTVIYDFNSTVGTTTSYATSVSYNKGNTKMTFGSDFRINEKKYISIAPKDGSDGFKAGDIITLKGYCDSKNPSGIVIYNSIADGAESIFKTNALAKSTSTTGGSEYTFTLTEDCTNLYFGRFGGGNTYLTSLNVTRPASSASKIRLTASFAEKAKVVVNTTETVNLPALTVKAGETALTNEQYNVEYASNATDVATISGDIITVKGEGTATITATITPVNAAQYEGTTATFQLTVKQPTQLNITVQDVTMNVTDAKSKQPVINVYGDNDKLLKEGTDYTLSFTVKDGTNVTVDDAGTFTPAGNPYKWTEGTTTFTVKATPNAASLGDTYAEGTVDFTYNVIQGKLTPHFLEVFSGRNIKFYPDGKQREITVPLIYDYEDVSDYFDYTYTIDGTEIKDTKGVSGIGKLGTKDKAHTLIYTVPTTKGTHTVVVSATPKTGSKEDGSDDYSNVYNTPATLSFTISVDSKYKRITLDLDPKEIDLTTGTSDGAPDVTVTYTDDKTVVPESEYSIAWSTSNESYARVNASTGHIEAVSEGQTKARCLVTGDNIESTTAFFTINVDDPTKYRVKSTGEYKNQTVMWNQNRTMAVTLGGWMFPENIQSTVFSSEGLRNTYVWGGDKATSEKATWAINGEQYVASGDNQKNARQENGANSLPESTTIYSADFKTTTQNIKDQMFGVPCSGSYLVFNPAKPGVVSVDILQNGSFDKKTDSKGNVNYQYRPQRRVFVMDEAGNFVKSEAVIGNANGKPLGKGNDRFTLSNYTWDITGQAPTMDLVNSHFDGLNDFEMSETGFKNNVYTSTLPQSYIPNQAAVNHKDEDDMESANGWAVLADGPVTYSFRVLPGKTYYLYNFGSKIGFYGFTFKEDETKPVVDNVKYDETSSNNIVKTTEDGHVATVKLNRTFKAGVWSTCVLPFSLNKAQVDAIFGETYSSNAKEGTEIIYFDRVENDKVWFVRHAYNTIVANKPFLIKPTKDVSEINTANITDYPYVIIEAPKTDSKKPADWCEGNGYKWVSGYNNNEMYVSKGDGFIATDGSFMNYTGSDAPLKGFRGYLKANLASGATPKMLSVGVGSNVEENGGSTTIVDRLFIDSNADAAQGIGDGKVYNINGQVVGSNSKALNTLPSGVYIINGKKYIK